MSRLTTPLFALILVFVGLSASAANWSRTYEKPFSVRGVSEASDGTFVATASWLGHAAILRLSRKDGSVAASREFSADVGPGLVFATRDGVVVQYWRGGENHLLALDDALTRVRFDVKLGLGQHDIITAGAAVPDGGVVLSLSTGKSSAAMKVSARGTIEWQKTYDATDNDHMSGIRPVREGYVAWGRVEGGPYLMKIKLDGTLIWARYYPRSGSIRGVRELATGDFLVTGLLTIERKSRLWLEKVDRDGKEFLELADTEESFKGGLLSVRGNSFIVNGDDREGSRSVIAVSPEGSVVSASKSRIAPSIYNILATESSFFLAGYGELVTLDGAGDGMPCVTNSRLSVHFEPIDLVSEALGLEISTSEYEISKSTPSVELKPLEMSSSACVAAAAPTVKAAPPVDPQLARYRDLRAVTEPFNARVRNLLVRKDFAALDALADGYRNSRDELKPMTTTLIQFYAVVDSPTLGGRVSVEDHQALLRQWIESRPDSLTARIALAAFLYSSAWQLRGMRTAESITDSAWAGYREGMKTFAKELESVAPRPRNDPEYYLLKIALAGEVGGEDVRAIARQSLAGGASDEVFFAASRFFLPQWGGSPEDYAAWAAESADATKSRYGDGVYALMALRVVAAAAFEENEFLPPMRAGRFDERHLSWPRVRQGFRDLLARYPQWLFFHHRFAFAALMAEDRPTLRELLALPELKWSKEAEDAWPIQVYDFAKSWVEEITPSDVLAGINTSRLLVRGTFERNGKAFQSLNTFFVQGPNGVVVVSTAPNSEELQETFTTFSGVPSKSTLSIFTNGRSEPAMVFSKFSRAGGRGSVAFVALVDPASASKMDVPVLRLGLPADKIAVLAACTTGQPLCSPHVYNGRVEAKGNYFEFVPDERVDFAQLIGSPVIQRGIVGVVMAAGDGRAICLPIDSLLIQGMNVQ